MDDTGAASFEELSKFSGQTNAADKISKSSLYRWAQNDQVSIRSAKRIAKAFSLNWQWVYSGTLPMKFDTVSDTTNENQQAPTQPEQNNSGTPLRLRLIKEVYKYYDWEIDLIKNTYTFHKQLIDAAARPNETLTIPLDDLFQYIIDEDHNTVIESLSECIHDLDNNIYSINYRYKTAEGIQTRHSYAIAEFDDYTRAVKIIGISVPVPVNAASKNANQLDLLTD